MATGPVRETGAVKPASTLYLRGIPVELARRAKAQAAGAGLTLTQFVIEAISSALEQEAVGAPTLTDPLDPDIKWFTQHKADLCVDFAGKYVAIIDKKVVDSDERFGPLAERVFGKFGVRSIFMPKCVIGERVIQVRSPKVAMS